MYVNPCVHGKVGLVFQSTFLANSHRNCVAALQLKTSKIRKKQPPKKWLHATGQTIHACGSPQFPNQFTSYLQAWRTVECVHLRQGAFSLADTLTMLALMLLSVVEKYIFRSYSSFVFDRLGIRLENLLFLQKVALKRMWMTSFQINLRSGVFCWDLDYAR